MAHYICTCGVDHPTSEGRIICGMEHKKVPKGSGELMATNDFLGRVTP